MNKEQLTSENYHTRRMNSRYWSVSQFKAFDRCEAAALAELKGEYEREETTALLIGSYVDSYFSGEQERFVADHPEIFNKRTGELKAEYRHADYIIERIKESGLSNFLAGSLQEIRTAQLFGSLWKIKMDVLGEDRIVDLKVVKDMGDVYEDGFGWRDFIAYWGYDVQGAIYQKVEQISSGREKPLPFYLAVATKEKEPDLRLIHIGQEALDTALKTVESKIDRFDLVKLGLIEPERCEKCEYCRRTRQIYGWIEYDTEERR